MLGISVLIFCLVGGGLLAMAAKYIKAVPPLDYHAEIMSGSAVSDETKMVLGALYKAMGGAFAGLGVGTILLALTGLWSDSLTAKLTLVAMLCIPGWFVARATHAVEARTNVKTPWRIAAALTALSLLGFVLSLI